MRIKDLPWFNRLGFKLIRKEINKSVIVWEIPELSKGEERLISYRLKSKTGHQGKLTIPRATCRYKNKMDKLSLSRSNEVTIYT